jgi:hypothetical protein
VAALPAPAASEEAPPEILAEGGDSGTVASEPEDRGAVDTYLLQFANGEGGGPSAMIVVAAILLLGGLGLFGLRWSSRRLGDG